MRSLQTPEMCHSQQVVVENVSDKQKSFPVRFNGKCFSRRHLTSCLPFSFVVCSVFNPLIFAKIARFQFWTSIITRVGRRDPKDLLWAKSSLAQENDQKLQHLLIASETKIIEIG